MIWHRGNCQRALARNERARIALLKLCCPSRARQLATQIPQRLQITPHIDAPSRALRPS
jgi:hypothetical protein